MAVLGVLITLLGWGLLVYAIAGRGFGFSSFSFIPGVVLLIAGRMLRTKAKRRRGDYDEGDLADLSTAPAPPSREPAPAPAPAPVRRTEPPRPAAPSPSTEPLADDDGDSYAEALRAAADDVLDEGARDEGDSVTGLSSAEMIARARRRWDRRA